MRLRVNVNCCDRNGCTGLMKASLNGHHDLVKALLGAGANVNARDALGQTALHYAVRGQHAPIIRLVCVKRVDTSAMTHTSRLMARDYAHQTVSREALSSRLTLTPSIADIDGEKRSGSAGSGEPAYLTQARIMRRAQEDTGWLLEADRAAGKSTTRIFELIRKCESMRLKEDTESADEDDKRRLYVQLYLKMHKKPAAVKKKAGKKGAKKKKKKK